MPTGLSSVVLDHARRLGAKLVPIPEDAPRRVVTPRGEREIPEPLLQWAHGLVWPKRIAYQGQLDRYRHCIHIRLDLWGPLEDQACARERDWFYVGSLSGGNVWLLVDLDDPSPEDPWLRTLDHDDGDREEPGGLDEIDHLSQLLARLEPMGRRR